MIYEDLERLKEKALQELEDLYEYQECHNIKFTHSAADEVLYTLLLELGYTKIVKAYTKIDKW